MSAAKGASDFPFSQFPKHLILLLCPKISSDKKKVQRQKCRIRDWPDVCRMKSLEPKVTFGLSESKYRVTANIKPALSVAIRDQ